MSLNQNPDKNEILKDLKEFELTPREIGDKYFISPRQVHYYAAEAGIDMKIRNELMRKIKQIEDLVAGIESLRKAFRQNVRTTNSPLDENPL